MQRPRQQQGGKQAALVHAAILAGLVSTPALAFEPVDLGEGFEARWTNSLRLSSLYEFNSVIPSTSYYCLPSWQSNCGYPAGFAQGRADLLSALAITRGADALHLSLDARKELVERNGSYVELFEAYLQTGATLAGGPLALRLGRHSLVWGESLLFPENSIAGAMNPIDQTAGRGTVGYQAASRYLPVGQASFSWQWSADWALIGYQQFEWRRNRVDADDAFASAADILARPPYSAIGFVTPNGRRPYWPSYNSQSNGNDQFGLGLRGSWGDADLGFYALRYDAKTPSIAYDIRERDYDLVEARRIDLLGFSLAKPLGDTSLAGEISFRHGAPLVNGGLYPAYVAPAGPIGNVVQGSLSLTVPIAPQTLLPGGASWSSELAGNHLLAVTLDQNQMTPSRSHSAAALRSIFTPQFYQLWPRVDLSMPISIGYNFFGLSPVLPEMDRGTGTVGFGVSAILDQRWSLSLGVTHYFGATKIPIALPGQPENRGPLSQWDDASFTLATSF